MIFYILNMLYFEVLYIHIESSWAFPVVDNNCFCATKIHDLFNDIDKWSELSTLQFTLKLKGKHGTSTIRYDSTYPKRNRNSRIK
jgi:hypothetical protein